MALQLRSLRLVNAARRNGILKISKLKPFPKEALTVESTVDTAENFKPTPCSLSHRHILTSCSLQT